MGDARPETIAMVAEWQRRDELYWNPPEQEPDDFLDRWLPAAAPHLDAGWNGYGLAPSKEIGLRYCMGMSGSLEMVSRTVAHAQWIMRRATALHRRGYHPNPLTTARPEIPVAQPFPPLSPEIGAPAVAPAGAPRPPAPETVHDR
ncbi:hypothetical protein K9B35_14435 [Sphingomonas sp. R647]|uniref:hypothetical protein n=1 Tax=Sphingomonas sp. R647 TaxID=2875233 RepID=UPI001CD2F3A5|nr:hypothetical protein [Sphingomonas sp. R647]MCA1199172.1 hypothetical protein [Sphingomonas sp. R647]